MVKFGRKFFFDNKHSKKTRIITIAVIAVVVIGLIIFFTTTSFFKPKSNNKPKETIVIRDELEIEVNTVLPEKTSYFEKLENFDANKITVTYPDNLPTENSIANCTEEEINILKDIEENNTPIEEGTDPYACISTIANAIGKYDINVNFNDKNYIVLLRVVDTTAPQVTLKELQITEGETYQITDFVESCSDNGKGECTYKYYYEDYENEKLDFGSHTAPGTYDIVIISADESGNISLPINTKLTILPKPEVKTYTVTFNSNGGSSIDSQTIIENEKATQPNNPTKDGYNFAGWYLGNTKYNFNNSVTSDITLTAKWTTKQSNNDNNNKDNNNNKPTTCSYGNLEYDKNKYPVVTVFVSNGNCAISTSEFNSYTYGNKVNLMQNAEAAKLQSWVKTTAYQGLNAYPTASAVLNKSGKGVVGYVLEISITQTVNGTTTEFARYKLDQNGKRVFELNPNKMPES